MAMGTGRSAASSKGSGSKIPLHDGSVQSAPPPISLDHYPRRLIHTAPANDTAHPLLTMAHIRATESLCITLVARGSIAVTARVSATRT